MAPRSTSLCSAVRLLKRLRPDRKPQPVVRRSCIHQNGERGFIGFHQSLDGVLIRGYSANSNQQGGRLARERDNVDSRGNEEHGRWLGYWREGAVVSIVVIFFLVDLISNCGHLEVTH